VRVRITERPKEHDLEGVSLDTLRPGTVCDVSALVGSWLILQGYAYPEMRHTPEDKEMETRSSVRHPSERRRR
jgi:hypothetical protein